MLQRLEKGENPDKLEEEYGDVMEKMDGMEGPGDGKKEDLKMRLRKRLPARRDPKLYEWEEFCLGKRKSSGGTKKKVSVGGRVRG